MGCEKSRNVIVRTEKTVKMAKIHRFRSEKPANGPFDANIPDCTANGKRPRVREGKNLPIYKEKNLKRSTDI